MMKMQNTRSIMLVQMGFGIGLMSILSVLLYKWTNIRELGSQVPQEPYMCLPAHLIQNDSHCTAEHLKALTLQNNGSVYCGVAGEVFKVVAELALCQQYDDNKHPEYRFYHAIFPEKCQLSKKESSKIMMTDPFVKDNATIEKIMWTTQNVNRGDYLNYSTHDGMITVMHDGYYLVGSQVLMQCKPPFDVKIFDQFIYLMRSSSVDILKNSKPIISLDDNVTVVTSYTGAVFHLNEGDQLYVATSPRNCVHDTEKYSHSNNFYVYAV